MSVPLPSEENERKLDEDEVEIWGEVGMWDVREIIKGDLGMNEDLESDFREVRGRGNIESRVSMLAFGGEGAVLGCLGVCLWGCGGICGCVVVYVFVRVCNNFRF